MYLSKKRGQVAIFTIIALVIVIFALFFFLFNRDIISPIEREFDVQSFVRSCAKQAVDQAIAIMLPQGGYLNPDNYKLYGGVEVEYLCYTNEYYGPCINQEPLYLVRVQNELSSFVEPKINECFFNLERELDDRGYSYETSGSDFSIELEEGSVRVGVDRILTYGKDTSQTVDNFDYQFNSRIYDLALVAREIANQEAKYCTFNTVSYMATYPEVDVEKKNIGFREDLTSIYVIRDRRTDETLQIAIRSCEVPPGFFG